MYVHIYVFVHVGELYSLLFHGVVCFLHLFFFFFLTPVLLVFRIAVSFVLVVTFIFISLCNGPTSLCL